MQCEPLLFRPTHPGHPGPGLQPPGAAELPALLHWYADRGHHVDRAHRRLELALLEGQTVLRGALVDLSLLLLAGVALLCGLAAAEVAVIDRLRREASGTERLLWLSALHVALGVALILGAARRRRAASPARWGACGWSRPPG